MKELYLLAYTNSCPASLQSPGPAQGMVPPTVDRTLPYELTIKTEPLPQTCPQASLQFLSQMTLG